MRSFRPLALGLALVSLAGVSWGEETVYQFSCDYPIYSNNEDAQMKQDFSFTMIVTENAEGELKGVMSGNAGASNLVVARGAYFLSRQMVAIGSLPRSYLKLKLMNGLACTQDIYGCSITLLRLRTSAPSPCDKKKT
jgi:hypothetical protein